MKAVAPDAVLRIFSGNGERLGERAAGCDGRRCRNRRPAADQDANFADRPNRREIMRLVQRRERDERRKLLDDLIRQEQRRRVIGAAVNDSVTDRGDVAPLEPLCADPHHRPRRGGVIEACVLEAFLNKLLALRVG